MPLYHDIRDKPFLPAMDSNISTIYPSDDNSASTLPAVSAKTVGKTVIAVYRKSLFVSPLRSS